MKSQRSSAPSAGGYPPQINGLLTVCLRIIYSYDAAWYRARYQAKYRASTIPPDTVWYRRYPMPVVSELYSHDRNEIATSFSGSGNTERLVIILYDVWVCWKSNMVVINRKLIGNSMYLSSYT